MPSDLPASEAALRDAAACGVALDPVYTAKALAGLRSDPPDGPVLLLRTHGPRPAGSVDVDP